MGLRVKRSDNFIPRVMRKILRVDFITLTITSHVACWLALFQIFQPTIRVPPATLARGTRMVYVDEHVARWRQRKKMRLLRNRYVWALALHLELEHPSSMDGSAARLVGGRAHEGDS